LNEWLAKLENHAADAYFEKPERSHDQGADVQKTASVICKRRFEGSRPGLVNLARTMFHSASHYAGEKVITEEFQDYIKGWRYVATLDRRICLVCGVNDGEFYKLSERKPNLPRHWSRRCCYVPVPKEIPGLPEMEHTRPAVKHDARTVHHRDGSGGPGLC
jgi:hypothetical protein